MLQFASIRSNQSMLLLCSARVAREFAFVHCSVGLRIHAVTLAARDRPRSSTNRGSSTKIPRLVGRVFSFYVGAVIGANRG